MTRGIHDHIALSQLLIARVALMDLCGPWIERHRILQIVHLGTAELLILVRDEELRHKALFEQGIRDMRSHMACSDDADLCLALHAILLSLRCIFHIRLYPLHRGAVQEPVPFWPIRPPSSRPAPS